MARRLMAALILVSLLGQWLAPGPAQAQNGDQRCFPETRQCVSGRVRVFWEQSGGVAVFGFPITAAAMEVNRDTGQTYLTQWFERNRFELHPENAAPYDVLLGRLGDDQLLLTGRNWQTLPRAEGPRADCLWFPQTRHTVCDQAPGLGFKSYWNGHGLTDPALDGFGRSLALFGLPLSEPAEETNAAGDTVLTQWFERARFEWHPGQPDQFKVLLGLLGNEVRGGGDPIPPPVPAPTPTAEPKPTATPRPRNEVTILGNHSSYTYTVGARTYLRVDGEVRNDTSRVVMPLVTARLYDAKGNRVDVRTNIYPRLSPLKPGQKAPFYVRFVDPPEGKARYELLADWEVTDVRPLEGIKVLSENVVPYPGVPTGRRIVGVVRNDSGVDTYIRLAATLYGDNGKVVGSGRGSLTLKSGQQGNYAVTIVRWNDAARWDVQALAVPPSQVSLLAPEPPDDEEE